MCAEFLRNLRASRPNSNGEYRVLVVGGGSRGYGTESLYAADDVDVVITDIYASADVEIVADAHTLPFVSGSFQGVWIQAVLEHVLDPKDVVGEIYRVLDGQGVVYAETPFMQPVHEGAWDFTRFTRSGHRWLFRQFDEVAAGEIGGAGEVILLAAHHLGRSLFKSTAIGHIFAPTRASSWGFGRTSQATASMS